MSANGQKVKAEQFRRLHHGPAMLVLPNAWDAASARIFELAGFPAIATTSSGVAAALGYSDGQQIGRDLLVEATARITRVVACPVSADVEAGYGESIAEIAHTVQRVIEAGVVGINIEDSLPRAGKALADISYQVELIQALKELGQSLDVPLVINARTDIFLRASASPESRVERAAERAEAYLRAGADCVYPIGSLPRHVIAELVQAIPGPINILMGSSSPALAELVSLGVARVTFGGGLMRAALGRLQALASELLDQSLPISLGKDALSDHDFESLFTKDQASPATHIG
jgi:2-methylisocitrate lyase-like PEP mutase family enzyme